MNDIAPLIQRRSRIVVTGAVGGLLALSASFSCSLLAHGNIDEQIVRVTAQLAETPENARLWLERGALHREHREWDAALRDFRRAAAIPASRALADVQIARVHAMRGAPTLALRHAERALDERADDLTALRLRAEARHAVGDLRGAVADYQRLVEAIELPRTELLLAHARAINAQGEEHVDAAVASLRKGLQRVGSTTLLEREIVDLYRGAGRIPEALVALDAIIAAQRRPERWLALRGDLLVEQGKRDAARGSYRAAIVAIDTLPAVRAEVPATRALREELVAKLETP